MHIYRTMRLKYCLLLQQSTKLRSSLRAHWQPHSDSFSIAPVWYKRGGKKRDEKMFCTSFMLLSLSTLLISAKRIRLDRGLSSLIYWKMSLNMAEGGLNQTSFEGPTQMIAQFHVSAEMKTSAATIHASSQRKQNTAHLPHSLSYSGKGTAQKNGREDSDRIPLFIRHLQLHSNIRTIVEDSQEQTGKPGITSKVNSKGVVHAICHIMLCLFLFLNNCPLPAQKGNFFHQEVCLCHEKSNEQMKRQFIIYLNITVG